MGIVPAVVWALNNRRGWTRLGKVFVIYGISTLISVALTLIILCLQISEVKGSFADGLEHVKFSLLKRSHGDPQIYTHNSSGLKADWRSVCRPYENSECYDFRDKTQKQWKQSTSFMGPFSFWSLIVFFIVLSIATALLLCLPWMKPDRNIGMAWVLATWFALGAPYSWFIIFKEHSAVHTHMNHVCWHMPFSWMVAATTGLFLKLLWRCLQKSLNIFSDYCLLR